MENERIYLYNLQLKIGKGYLHCAGQIILDSIRFYDSAGDITDQYLKKLLFLNNGRIVEMLASCMDYDVQKFRNACIKELDRQYNLKQKTIL